MRKTNRLPEYSIKSFTESPGTTFYCNRLSIHLQKHHFVMEPHKHDFYTCVLFTAGKGTHMIDFTDHKVQPGSIFFLLPGQVHDWKLSADIEGYIFFHSREFFETNFKSRLHHFPFYNNISSSPALTLKGNRKALLNSLFELIFEESRLNNPFSKENVLAAINVIYTQCSAGMPVEERKAINPYSEKIAKFIRLVEDHFHSHHDVGYYAEKLNITARHLNRLSVSELHRKASEVIAGRIILEAKRLLTLTENNINEIAERTGYDDSSYFVRFFKKHEGQTPGDFRKSLE